MNISLEDKEGKKKIRILVFGRTHDIREEESTEVLSETQGFWILGVRGEAAVKSEAKEGHMGVT